MATQTEKPQLSRGITSKLSGLRWRIRSYVWMEGIALGVAWIGLTFWVVLAIDYGPVWLGRKLGALIPSLAGLPESPVIVRAALLAAVVISLAAIFYRWVLRRAFVPMADRSMAVVLERQFDEFHDSLVTSVEMAEHPDHAEEFNDAMLSRTSEDAQAQIGGIRLRRVFNFSPLQFNLAAAVFFVLTIGALGVTQHQFLLQAAGRMYLLGNTPWPRAAEIEVVGVEVQRTVVRTTKKSGDDAEENSGDDENLRSFDNGPVKVAKGSNLVLKVRANASKMKIPDLCTVFFTTEEGQSSWENMSKIGNPIDGYQPYAFAGKPFKGILTSMDFHVVGFDHKTRVHHIEVVDNPVISKVTLECVFPDYMVDEENNLYTPRDLTWVSGTKLPRGTNIRLRGRANKPLDQVQVRFASSGDDSGDADRTETIKVKGDDNKEFVLRIGKLNRDVSMEVTLHDKDGVIAETPERIYIGLVEDEPPEVLTQLHGIGTAVTPNVRIPLTGQIDDDYKADQAWVEIQTPEIDQYKHPVEFPKSGKVDMVVDFRELRDREKDPIELKPAENAKLTVTVKSSDLFDLTGQPNVGSGDHYELDIVTPDQLLAILDREEAGQRRRLEQIHQEMTDARDWLIRVKSDGLTSAGSEPGDEPGDRSGSEPEDAKEDADKIAARLLSLRLLFTQRSLLQTRKSAQEVLGVAGTFRDIYQQLENNRIDAEDRKLRLKEEVAEPLQKIGDQVFSDLELLIEALETQLKSLEKEPKSKKIADEANNAAESAIDHADYLLAELDTILGKLIKFETYAELLDIVRDLIDNQDEVIDVTKDENKKDLLRD